MQIIVGGRRSGKTYEAIKWMNDHPEAIMVTHDHRERERLEVDFPLLEGRIFTATQGRDGKLRGKQNPVLIDNLDIIIRQFFSPNIEVVTATGSVAFLHGGIKL